MLGLYMPTQSCILERISTNDIYIYIYIYRREREREEDECGYIDGCMDRGKDGRSNRGADRLTEEPTYGCSRLVTLICKQLAREIT